MSSSACSTDNKAQTIKQSPIKRTSSRHNKYMVHGGGYFRCPRAWSPIVLVSNKTELQATVEHYVLPASSANSRHGAGKNHMLLHTGPKASSSFMVYCMHRSQSNDMVASVRPRYIPL